MGKGATLRDDGTRQWSLFDGANPLKITKPLRLIELFAGIGAQAKALENLGVNFEHYRIVYQIYLQMQKFGAVINKVHIWNLCDLFALTVFGLLGDFALLIKLEEINKKIKWQEERFKK